MALQIRRGTSASRTSITPASGELLYTTDTKLLYVGDGTTAGGNQIGGLTAGYGDTTNPYASKTANYVLAAPNGSNGVPSFRALTFSDFPTRVVTTTSTATLSWSSDNSDQQNITALAAGLTISADSGSPAAGQKIMFYIVDNGTARTLTWTTGVSKGFRALGVNLPTSTVANKAMYVGAIYNAIVSRWDVVAVAQEA